MAAEKETRTPEQRREDKRLYGEMDRKAKHLDPTKLAVYLATKGTHAKRQKLKEIFMEQGGDLGASMTIFEEEQLVDSRKVKQDWIPMTKQEIHDKFGPTAGDAIIEALKKDKAKIKVVEKNGILVLETKLKPFQRQP